jgi:hypothetical protein
MIIQTPPRANDLPAAGFLLARGGACGFIRVRWMEPS